MTTPKMSDEAVEHSGNSNSSNNGKHKSRKWLHPRRWKLQLHGRQNNNINTSNASSVQALSLQQDLEELASLVAAASSSTGSSNGIAEWSLEELLLDLTKWKQQPWREGGGGNLNNDAQIVHLRSNDNSDCYALKRLATATPSFRQRGGSRDKKALAARNQQLAAATLVKEAKLLARMGEHPHILALRGLPNVDLLTSDTTSDNFFLLTDPLHRETLDTRIRNWKQSALAAAAATSKANNTSSRSLAALEEFSTSVSNFIHMPTTYLPEDDMIPRKSSYAYQIATALRACHQAGVVVRDLSPHKIGFKRADPHVVQLFDLGHATTTRTTTLDDIHKTHNTTPAAPEPLVGKRRYMAGEIWMTGQYSPKTDIYSWAMIYYEMLAEQKPYHDLSAMEHQTYVCQKGQERPPLDDYCLPDEIEALLEKAWSHSPKERQSSDQLCDDMQTLLLQLDACLFHWSCDDGPQLQDKDDFLFDVHYGAEDEEETISVMGDDDDDVFTSLQDHDPAAVFQASDSHLVFTEEDNDDNGVVVHQQHHQNPASTSTSSVLSKDDVHHQDAKHTTPPRAKQRPSHSITTTTTLSDPDSENKPHKIVSSAA